MSTRSFSSALMSLRSMSLYEVVAERNGKSVAQVALRWSLQKGFLPLPKSVTPKNIEANLDIFDFDLSEEDMAVLDKIQGIKTQDNPDTVNF